MPRALKAFPFDKKNEQDFENLTQRLREALNMIETNRSLKPTQKVLAKLAECSRKTLHLRRWPVEELKRIKDARRPKGESEPEVAMERSSKDTSRENQLIKQIRNYQSENGKLFDRIQHFEQEQTTWGLIRKSLEEKLAIAMGEIPYLEKELGSGEQEQMSALSLVEPEAVINN